MCCVQYQICPDQASTVAADGSPGFSLSPEAVAPFVDDNCATEDYVGIDTSGNTVAVTVFL